MSVPLPTPSELDREPQLAALAALDAALAAARAALVSRHPTLRDPETPYRVRHEDLYGAVAYVIVCNADRLAGQIDLYAKLLHNETLLGILQIYAAIDEADF